MKTKLLLIALMTFAAASAFAHAGHIHTYMGTVTMLHDDNAFMMKTTDGKDMTVQTSSKTQYLHADDHVAKRSELTPGVRVVVKMNTDGKTAATVKMSPVKKTE